MGFLTHLYQTAVQHPYDVLWNGFGFLGAMVFGIRFLVQWLRSEQAGHSVIPIAFWYLSLTGGLISFIYAVHQQAWPLVLSQGMPLPIYARNIWMIYRDRSRVRESV
jgi:lipid-A-disaccharide synthase-like uncharacterized protein